MVDAIAHGGELAIEKDTDGVFYIHLNNITAVLKYIILYMYMTRKTNTIIHSRRSTEK